MKQPEPGTNRRQGGFHQATRVPFEEKVLAVHRSLEGAGISHAFSGAIALAYHMASPRGTDDIDVNIALSGHEAGRALRSRPPQVRWTGRHRVIAEVNGEVKLRWMKETAVDLFEGARLPEPDRLPLPPEQDS